MNNKDTSEIDNKAEIKSLNTLQNEITENLNNIKKDLNSSENIINEINDGYIFFDPYGKPVSQQRLIHNTIVIGKLLHIILNMTSDELTINENTYKKVNYYTVSFNDMIEENIESIPELKTYLEISKNYQDMDEVYIDRYNLSILYKILLDMEDNVKEAKLLEIIYIGILEFIDKNMLNGDKILYLATNFDEIFGHKDISKDEKDINTTGEAGKDEKNINTIGEGGKDEKDISKDNNVTEKDISKDDNTIYKTGEAGKDVNTTGEGGKDILKDNSKNDDYTHTEDEKNN